MLETVFCKKPILKDIPGNNEELLRKTALRLSVDNAEHRDLAARLLTENKVGVIAFNGIYGLFANSDDKTANERILKIKDRPQDKNLILVSAPEYLHEHVDFSHSHYSQEQIIDLQKNLHALGVILPAADSAPDHLISRKDNLNTVLSIWTEYDPLRDIIEKFRELGGRALTGTSANRGGQSTHIDNEEAWQDFKNDVDFVLEADYSKLPEIRRRSTSVIDLTQPQPRLHRLGNVTEEEIQNALLKFGFPDLTINKEKTLYVIPRSVSISSLPSGKKEARKY